MQRKNIKNPLILKHFDRSREFTNNILFLLAITKQNEAKNQLISDELRVAMGWEKSITNMDRYLKIMYPNIYHRIYHICIISLCSDIEFLFKDIFEIYYREKEIKDNGFYQRIKCVVKALEFEGINFNDIDEVISNIFLAFQVRHISIHNMGIVDKRFIRNTGKGDEGQIFIVDQLFYIKMFNSYMCFLKHLDDRLPKST